MKIWNIEIKNLYLSWLHRVCNNTILTDGSGKYLINIFVIMRYYDYDNNGNPRDFIDENRIFWKYIGKGLGGCDHWMGRQE